MFASLSYRTAKTDAETDEWTKEMLPNTEFEHPLEQEGDEGTNGREKVS